MNYYIVFIFFYYFKEQQYALTTLDKTGQLPGVLYFLKLKLSVTFIPWAIHRVA